MEILKLVNTGLNPPLVTLAEIYNHQPNSNRPDQQAVLAGWRNRLRVHFGLTLLPLPAAAAVPEKIVSTPVWTVNIGKQDPNYAVKLVVSPDGRLLATFPSQTRTVTVRTADGGQPLWQKTAPTTWRSVVFPPDAPRHLLLSYSDVRSNLLVQDINVDDQTMVQRTVKNWAGENGSFDRMLTRAAFVVGVNDLKTGQLLWQLPVDGPRGGSNPIRAGLLALSADGRFLAVTGVRNWPHQVRVFDAGDGKPLRDFNDFASAIVGFALTPDGKLLAVASQADGVRIWDVASGKLQLSRTWALGDPGGSKRPCLVMSPDGSRLAVVSMPILPESGGAYEFHLGVFDVATGALSREIHYSEGDTLNFTLSAVAFSPDNKLLYTAGRQLTAWSLE